MEDLKFDASSTDSLTIEENGFVICSTETEEVGHSSVFATVEYNLTAGPEMTGNYFEVEIMEGGDDCGIGVGFGCRHAGSDFTESEMPGHNSSSYGYHGDDGNLWFDSNTVNDTWETWYEGDVIGCGINFENQSIFYTRNGSFIGTAFENVSHKQLSPMIGLVRDAVHRVKINFGGTPFLYEGLEVIYHPAKKSMNTTDGSGELEKFVDRTPLPWLNMIIHEIFSIRVLGAKALMCFSHHDEKERSVGYRWVESSLFARREDIVDDNEQLTFLRRFTNEDVSSHEDCSKLVAIMRKCVLQDRSGGDKEDSRVTHATCAAMIWHKGLGAEALALVRGDRAQPSKAMIEVWRYGQGMREYLSQGDLQNAMEQGVASRNGMEEEKGDGEGSLYPGAPPDVKEAVIRNTISRARYLFTFATSHSSKATTRKA